MLMSSVIALSMRLQRFCQTRIAVKAAIKDLETANVDVSTIRVLHGEKGVQILDPTGAEHGLGTQIVRWLQRLGYDRNILDVYEEALDKGESLITVPWTPRIAALWGG